MLVTSDAIELTDTGVYAVGNGDQTGAMNVKDIRRANLETVLDEIGGPKALAERIDGWVPNYVSQLRSKKKSFGDIAAEKIEIAAGKHRGWMDITHEESSSKRVRSDALPEPTLAELRNAINSTQMALGAMAAIMAGMRQEEGAAVAALFLSQADKLILPDMGLSEAFLKALRAAVSSKARSRKGG